MKQSTFIALLIPFILVACSADISDKERVDVFYKNKLDNIEADIDKTISEYSTGIVTKYYPEPYFNPTKPIPHYYAEKLDRMGIPYPKELVYINDDYNFYKDRAQFNSENYVNVEAEAGHDH